MGDHHPTNGIACLCTSCRSDAALDEVEVLLTRLASTEAAYQRGLREIHQELLDLQAKIDTIRIALTPDLTAGR